MERPIAVLSGKYWVLKFFPPLPSKRGGEEMDDKDKALFDKFNTAFNSSRSSYEDSIVAVAKAVIDAAVKAEREACAKIADDHHESASLVVFTLESGPERDAELIKVDTAVEIAAAIRSRSSEGGNG